MRQNVKEFVRVVSATLPIPEPIYEFGSFQVDRQLGFADLRPLFPNKEYVGCDMRDARHWKKYTGYSSQMGLWSSRRSWTFGYMIARMITGDSRPRRSNRF